MLIVTYVTHKPPSEVQKQTKATTHERTSQNSVWRPASLHRVAQGPPRSRQAATSCPALPCPAPWRVLQTHLNPVGPSPTGLAHLPAPPPSAGASAARASGRPGVLSKGPNTSAMTALDLPRTRTHRRGQGGGREAAPGCGPEAGCPPKRGDRFRRRRAVPAHTFPRVDCRRAWNRHAELRTSLHTPPPAGDRGSWPGARGRRSTGGSGCLSRR